MATKKGRRTKTTGGLYKRASDGMWCASIELPSPDPTKRRRKVIVRAKKSDAIKALSDARKELDRAGDLATSTPTITQWCDLWWDRYGMKRLKVSTRSTYKSKIEHYIKPAIGRIRLDRLSVEHVYRLHEYVTDTLGLEPASALAAHRVLSVMVSDAEKEGKVSRNVVRIADKPKVLKKKTEYLDGAQARSLLMSVAKNPDLAARWTTAILTGARQGERLGLTADMVDFKAGTMTVAWQLRRLPFQHGCGDLAGEKYPCGRKRGGNCPKRVLDVPKNQEVVQVEGGLYLTRPKTDAGWRTFPMIGMLHEVLQTYVDLNPPGMHGLIFTRDGGRPIDPSDDGDEWDRSLRAAGLPDVTGHSARHTCNTVLTELGVPVDVRQKILGHGSKAVNEAVYTHTSDVRVAAAMEELNAALDWRRAIEVSG